VADVPSGLSLISPQETKKKLCYERCILYVTGLPYLKRLVAGFPPRRPGFAPGQYVGFVVDKAALGQVFEYFGFPCQSFHQFLLHHNHPGLAQ
jgi:hypothetical protein